MRRLLLTAIALALMLGCPKKQLNTGGTGYGFETKRIYTIAVFRPMSAVRFLRTSFCATRRIRSSLTA